MAKEIYIAGEWRLGRGAVIQSLFPADQSVNAELSTATLEDVNEAIEKAEQAWRQPIFANYQYNRTLPKFLAWVLQ